MPVSEPSSVDQIIDLGGPDGGRYWLVTSDHDADHPDALNAAVHARATGSVGCAYNGATVESHPFCSACSHHHGEDEPCLCPDCGGPVRDRGATHAACAS